MDEGTFLALERDYDFATGKNGVSVVYAEIGAATDILNTVSLAGVAYSPMTRAVLLDMGDPFMGVDLDNMEAMSWGKVLANGNRSLIIAADDNFNPTTQNTLFMAFEVIPAAIAPVPLPAGLPLLLTGIGALGLARRVMAEPKGWLAAPSDRAGQPAQGLAAIDKQGLAGDQRSLRRGKKSDGRGDFCRIGRPAPRLTAGSGGDPLGPEGSDHRGPGKARGDGIDADQPVAQFKSHGTDHANHRSLR